MQYYISKTKAAFNPCDTNTPDTFVSRGYDTREEAAEALEVIEAIDTMFAEKSDICIIQHDPNKMPTQRFVLRSLWMRPIMCAWLKHPRDR